MTWDPVGDTIFIYIIGFVGILITTIIFGI